MLEYKIANYFLDRDRIEKFLQKFDLKLENDVERTIIVLDKDRIIATASTSKNVLKCFAIDPKYRNMAITNTLVTKLMEYNYERGISHMFIFTKPKNKKIFSDMGFKEVTSTNTVTLLDNKIELLYNKIESIKDSRKSGSIVINANPMTKGHLYLIKKAASDVKILHIFVVSEEKSYFSFEERFEIVKKNCENLENVIVHKAGEYIISSNTFPTYFYKDKGIIMDEYAKLDLKIFGEYFVNALNIKKRYVGEELTDVVTKNYNENMKKILPMYDVEVVEIKRLKEEGEVVSASKVRKFLEEKNYDEAFKYLPDATIEFLREKYGLHR